MKQILVVDDEKDLREAIVNLLHYEGYGTIEADNGLSALELAKKVKPDLIISDIMMPNINGFILSEMLREDPSVAGIPMILISGSAQHAGAWKTDEKYEYVEKPFTGCDFMSVVKNNLINRG